jgi:hypothetical protein
MWYNKENIRKKTIKDKMLKFYKVMAIPKLMYGFQFLTMNKADRSTAEAAEIKFLYVAE